MKQKIIYIGLSICLIGTFFSCYDDKGNYDYEDVNELIITGIKDEYRLLVWDSVLVIEPVINSKFQSSYEYLWYTIETPSTQEKYDTLSTEKDLVYLTQLKPANHTLVFKVTDLQTGVSTYAKTLLNVVTEFSDGLLVLREKEGYTDMDMFDINDKFSSGILEVMQGTPLKGSPVTIGFTKKYYLGVTSTGALAAMDCLLPMSDQEIRVLNANTMELVRTYEEMLYGYPENYLPQHFGSGRSDIAIMVDNTIYNCPIVGSPTNMMFEPYTQKYKFYPKFFGLDSWMCAFEETTGSFMRLSMGNLYKMKEGIPHKLLHAFLDENYWTVLGLFQGKIDTDSLYYYREADDNIYTLPYGMKAAKAKLIANNQNNELIYFFVQEESDKLYMLNPNQRTEEVIYDFRGEEITFIVHLTKPWGGGLENNLVVATYANGNYKINIFEILAGKPTGSPVKVYEGEGRAGYVFNMSSAYTITNPPNIY